jgi:hypothetical protein
MKRFRKSKPNTWQNVFFRLYLTRAFKYRRLTHPRKREGLQRSVATLGRDDAAVQMAGLAGTSLNFESDAD